MRDQSRAKRDLSKRLHASRERSAMSRFASRASFKLNLRRRSDRSMSHFSPLPALIGGLLIGLGSIALLLFNGRIAGISGIVAGSARPTPGDGAWRWLFLAGLVTGGLLVRLVSSHAFDGPSTSLPTLAVAGVLVGVGSRIAGGCTSGHGVCGTARLSRRSIVATVTFIVAGALAVFLVHRGGLS